MAACDGIWLMVSKRAREKGDCALVSQARILVVDDERELCMALHDLLEREGYEVECAYDGSMALRVGCEGG